MMYSSSTGLQRDLHPLSTVAHFQAPPTSRKLSHQSSEMIENYGIYCRSCRFMMIFDRKSC
jgi:hypothetical protein